MPSFSELNGWDDVTPVAQDDGPNAVVTIAYTPYFRELMDLFRAVLRSGELSERVLELTEAILDENAANYTVWQYRRECLRHLSSDLKEELLFMDTFAEENPKNYQIWYHRRAVVEQLGEAGSELSFCAKVFETDAKNYHAWAHRQWVLQTFNNWEGELAFVEQLLGGDVRNNSAWNQRWFVVHSGPHPVTPAVLTRELSYVLSSIDLIGRNESAWNYLRGLGRYHPELKGEIIKKCSEFDDCADSGTAKRTGKGKGTGGKGDNPFALSLLADLRESDGTQEGLIHAERLFLALCRVDKIRVKYWTRRGEKVRKTLLSAEMK